MQWVFFSSHQQNYNDLKSEIYVSRWWEISVDITSYKSLNIWHFTACFPTFPPHRVWYVTIILLHHITLSVMTLLLKGPYSVMHAQVLLGHTTTVSCCAYLLNYLVANHASKFFLYTLVYIYIYIYIYNFSPWWWIKHVVMHNDLCGMVGWSN